MVDANSESPDSRRNTKFPATAGEIPKWHWEKLIELVDSRTPSPSERAKKIYEVIQLFYAKSDNPQWDWDLLCFCEEVLINLSHDIHFLQPIARALNVQLYRHHYQLAYEIGLITPDGTKETESKKEEGTEGTNHISNGTQETK